jgi:adenylate cyclase
MLSNMSKEGFVPPYYFALIYNGLGETEKAISWLELGFEQRDSKMVFLKVEPKWDNLRSNPRFIKLLKLMNWT